MSRYFTVTAIKYWNRLPRELVDSILVDSQNLTEQDIKQYPDPIRPVLSRGLDHIQRSLPTSVVLTASQSHISDLQYIWMLCLSSYTVSRVILIHGTSGLLVPHPILWRGKSFNDGVLHTKVELNSFIFINSIAFLFSDVTFARKVSNNWQNSRRNVD